MFKKKNRSMGTKLLLIVVLSIGCCMHAEPVYATAATGYILRLSKWIAELLIDYKVGQDREQELAELKRDLIEPYTDN